MTKVRQDAWSHEDDVLLAETVLKHIQNGSTQLMAFDEAGDILNRTSAACGFRWNSEVRNTYEDKVQMAKKQRKENKRHLAQAKGSITTKAVEQSNHQEKPTNSIQISPTSLTDVIVFLQNLSTEDTHSIYQLAVENNGLLQEHQLLQQEYDALLRKYNHLQKEQATVREDYQSLMAIMNRASKLLFSNEDKVTTTMMAPIFQMDQNGSIEIIEPSV